MITIINYCGNKMDKIITTSWDDGHPLDFRIAELLDKYDLKGTFYIPKNNPQNTVMSENDVALLHHKFEIGGHTLNHVNLKKLDNSNLVHEINGSCYWLNEVTGVKPISFCPPFGAYNAASLKIIYLAGFKVIRTTQLLSPDLLLPVNYTTLQLFNHSSYTYAKHLLIRGRVTDFKLWLYSGATSDMLNLIDYYLNYIDMNGGCFHLWGHSWEIEKFNLWKQLEIVFKHLSNRSDYNYMENGQLSNYIQTQK